MAHVDLGSQLLARVREDIDETAKIEAEPKDGRPPDGDGHRSEIGDRLWCCQVAAIYAQKARLKFDLSRQVAYKSGRNISRPG